MRTRPLHAPRPDASRGPQTDALTSIAARPLPLALDSGAPRGRQPDALTSIAARPFPHGPRPSRRRSAARADQAR